MYIAYDSNVDVAYIKVDEISKYKSTTSFKAENIFSFGEINIDLAKDDKIIGLEIVNASKYLSKNVLKESKQLN